MLTHAFKRLKEEKAPLKFLWSRALWHSGACSLFAIQRSNYKLRFFPTALSASLFYDNHYGEEEEQILKALLNTGDTFVDIGANIGHLSLFAATLVGEQGKVYAFEPHPKTFSFFKQNIELNNMTNIRANNCGLAEKEGVLNFTDSRSDDQNFILQESTSGVTVEVKTLDSCLPLEKINLLKVDTEGYEKFVFQGATKTLTNTEMVYFETNENNCQRFNYSVSDLLDLLSGFGFNFFEYKEGQWVEFNYKNTLSLPKDLLAKK